MNSNIDSKDNSSIFSNNINVNQERNQAINLNNIKDDMDLKDINEDVYNHLDSSYTLIDEIHNFINYLEETRRILVTSNEKSSRHEWLQINEKFNYLKESQEVMNSSIELIKERIDSFIIDNKLNDDMLEIHLNELFPSYEQLIVNCNIISKDIDYLFDKLNIFKYQNTSCTSSTYKNIIDTFKYM